MKYNFTKEELQDVVLRCLSIAEVCRQLGIRPAGGNYKTIRQKIKKFEIDISHFTGAAWNVGDRFKPFSKTIDLELILVKDSDYTNTNRLKQRLIKAGMLLHECSICKLSEWCGKPIPIELDHINGINTDNRIENLRILCPNCHAQTDTYRGKQKISSISNLRNEKYCKFVNEKDY